MDKSTIEYIALGYPVVDYRILKQKLARQVAEGFLDKLACKQATADRWMKQAF